MPATEYVGTGIIAPRPMWVILRPSGSSTLNVNPEWAAACARKYLIADCPPPLAGRTFGPMGSDPDHPQEWMFYVGYHSNATGGVVLRWMEQGDEIVAMYQRGFARSFFCFVWWCGTPHTVPSYTPTGSFTVEAEEVQPAQITTSPPVVQPGQPLRFTASSLLSQYRMTVEQWLFAPGDTAAEPAFSVGFINGRLHHDGTWLQKRIVACDALTACDYSPPASGRMYARVRFDVPGVNVANGVVAGSVVRSGPAKLVLTCNGVRIEAGGQPMNVALRRGEEITCTASATEGTAQVQGWSFSGDGHSASAGAVPEWKGPMLRSGQITVRGSVDGQATSITARVRVGDRNWPMMTLPTPNVHTAVGPDMSPYPPDAAVAKLYGGAMLGQFELSRPEFAALPAIEVTTGPNSGLAALASPVTLPPPSVFIHPALYPTPAGLNSTSAGYQEWHRWYDDQNGTGSGTCHSPKIAWLEGEVRRHEGATQAVNSHFGKAKDLIASSRLHLRLDRVVAPGGAGEAQARAAQVFYSWFSSYLLVQAAFDASEYPTIGSKLNCLLDNNRNDN